MYAVLRLQTTYAVFHLTEFLFVLLVEGDAREHLLPQPGLLEIGPEVSVASYKRADFAHGGVEDRRYAALGFVPFRHLLTKLVILKDTSE